MNGPIFRGERRAASPYLQTGATGAQEAASQVRPFSPRNAVDLEYATDLRRREQGQNIVPIADVIDLLTAHNRPPQLVQAGYIGQILAAGVADAIMLVPKNPHRQSMKIANPSPNGNVTFSYDAPLAIGGFGMGIPVAAGTYDEESNGSVSINAIYVWSDQATATFPISVIAYEGVLSVVGNRP
jgi:hypothetical protein